MPDYTEEDVERVARVLEPEVFSDDPIIAHRSASPLTVTVVREKALTFARATLDITYPLAFTAGALAMKEAARTIAQAWIDRGSPDISLLPTAIGSISVSALPVPPRGSKI